MSNIVIKVENISKQYRLGKVGTGSLAHDLNRTWHRLRGKEDPYLKIGEMNDRSFKGGSEYVWALQDINFDVKRGEVLGIIGRNGAGKSTLLKILSRTTTPTTGQIKIRGRIASLLEVGTGFHPDLSGRENIFLNGAILGMTKTEIKNKFDEIVDFAGVERYIDTPVKRYSSGMYVRLAFGVAAHLEPEILIVDEVLAVGDAEFQKKAIGKMKDVSDKEGRTVLFVSHNIAAIHTLTNRCLYLQNGKFVQIGNTDEIITLYQHSGNPETGNLLRYVKDTLNENKPIELLSSNVEVSDKSVAVSVHYIVRREVGSVVSIKIVNLQGIPIITLRDTDKDAESFSKSPGKYAVMFTVPLTSLAPNIFKITFSFSDMKSERFDYMEDLLSFTINEQKSNINATAARDGILNPQADFVSATQII